MNGEVINLIFSIFVYIGLITVTVMILRYRHHLSLANDEIEILEKELQIEKKENKKIKQILRIENNLKNHFLKKKKI